MKVVFVSALSSTPVFLSRPVCHINNSPKILVNLTKFATEKHTSLQRLFIKPGKQERGTECGECGERGECSLGFRGNVIILTFRGMFQRIPGNVEEDSGECSRGFRGMFEEIPGNVQEDSGEIPGNVQENSGECLRGFRGMFKKIPGNAQEDFGESKFRFVL